MYQRVGRNFRRPRPPLDQRPGTKLVDKLYETNDFGEPTPDIVFMGSDAIRKCPLTEPVITYLNRPKHIYRHFRESL